jgi:two-component system LytT family response regulator
MYKCLVVDDNIIERDAVIMHLSKIKKVKIVAECSNGLDALEVLQKNEVDIVISDIDMPNLTGIGLIKNLKKVPIFIFVTAFTEFAAESFNLNVIDYIVKPASFERILKAVNKAIDVLDAKQSIEKNNTNEQYSKTVNADDYFFIKENSNYIKLHLADVIFIESMGDFSKLHTINNKKHIVLISLKNIDKQLPPNMFTRIHKQYIINLLHIVSVGNTEITLANNSIVPISNVYKQELLEAVVEKKTLKRFG